MEGRASRGPMLLVVTLVVALAVAAFLINQPWISTAPPTPDRPADQPVVQEPPPLDPAESEDSTAAAPTAFLVTGHVIDWHRRPVAGGQVSLTLPDGRCKKTLSDEAGRFRFPLAQPPRRDAHFAIHATSPKGLAGTWVETRNSVDEGVLDVGRIVLWIGYEVSVRVVSSTGGSVEGTRVFLTTEGGILAEVIADETGIARLTPIHAGTFEVIVTDGAEQRGSRIVVMPRDVGETFEVALRPTRTVAVRVLDRDSGLPVPGAVIRIERECRSGAGNVHLGGPFPALPDIAPTDETGTTWIRGTEPGDLIRIRHVLAPGRAPGGPYPDYISPGETKREIRIPVHAEETPTASEGAEPTRTLTVRVREPDGSPAANVAFYLRDSDDDPATGILRTDEAGVARATGLPAAPLDVTILPHPAYSAAGHEAARANLTEGDREVEITVGRRRELVFRFTENGVPCLPSSFNLSVDFVGAFDTTEVPERGEIRFHRRPLRHERAIWFQFDAHTFFWRDGWLWPPKEGDRAIFDIELSRGGGLVAKIVPPGDGLSSLKILRREESGDWRPPDNFRPPLHPDPDGVLRLRPLLGGTYKLVDRESGLFAGPFKIAPGDKPATTTLDLSRSGWVTGKVVFPKGFRLSRATVHRERPGLEARGTRVDASGSFRIRVPGDRPVTLTVRHPVLKPAADGGSVGIKDPRGEVMLRLVAETVATFRVEEDLLYSDRRVLLFLGEPRGEPVFTREIVSLPRKQHRFGGYEPGTYTVFIDIPGFVPAILLDRVLGKGTIDLGIVPLKRGSSLRVKVKGPDEDEPSYHRIIARRKDAPFYVREAAWEGKDVVLTGIGKGTFDVWIQQPRWEPLSTRTMEFDGKTDREIVFDLR